MSVYDLFDSTYYTLECCGKEGYLINVGEMIKRMVKEGFRTRWI